MPGRPLNNWLMKKFGNWTGYGASRDRSVRGTIELQVPRALAEAGVIHGPAPLRDFHPTPKLPRNAYVAR